MRFIPFGALLFLSLIQTVAQPYYLKDSLLKAGHQWMYYGDFEKANQSFFDALREAEKRDDRLIMAESYRLLGEVNRAAYNKEYAIPYLDKAEELFNALGDEYGIASTKNRKAAVYFELKQYDKFLTYLQHSLKSSRKHGYRQLEYNNLTLEGAYTFYVKKDYTAARGILDEAWSLVQELKSFQDYPYILNNLVKLHEELGNLDSALYYAHKSFDFSEEHHILTSQLNASERISRLYERQRNYELALKYERIYNALSRELLDQSRRNAMAQMSETFENEKKEETIREQRLYLTIFIILGALILLILVVLLFSYRNLRKLNRQLKEAHGELETSVVLRDKLLSVLSHDLRAPLASIANLLELNSYEELDKAEMKQMMAELNIRISRTTNLLDNVLLWIKGQIRTIEPRFEQVNLGYLIQECSHLMGPQLAGKQLSLKYDNVRGQLRTDKEMLRFIIRNLISNAIKYSHTGGTIELGSELQNAKMLLWVKDEGVGMDDLTSENLFELPKYSSRGTSDEMGMGIGLTIVRDFVHLLKGSVSIETEQGRGSRFIVALPLNQEGPEVLS